MKKTSADLKGLLIISLCDRVANGELDDDIHNPIQLVSSIYNPPKLSFPAKVLIVFKALDTIGNYSK